jgi:ACS family D-galactonate transporter-like MFS transporter
MVETVLPAPANAAVTDHDAVKPLPQWQRWATVWLLCLGMIIAYIDRANLSVAVADDAFKSFFRLTNTASGTLNSAFFWTYAVLQIPAGFLVDRFGVKKPYSAFFVTWCAISALTAAAGSMGQLIAIRLLLGVGESLVTPASLRWIRFNIPERSRGMALGIYMAGTKFGPAVGSPLAAKLIGIFDWRMMFIVLGLGGLIWLVPWLLMVRDDDRKLEVLSAKKAAQPVMPFSEVLKTPILWGVLAGTFCYNYFVFFSMTWLPTYFKEHRHLSLEKSGAYTGFSFAGMAIVAIVAGWAADRLIARGWDAIKVRKAFTIAGFVIASSEIFGAMSSSNNVALTMSIISLSGLGLTTANYWALTQTMLPRAAIGTIAGAQNAASNLAGAAAPLITGKLIDLTGNYEAPMQAIWVFLLVGIAMYVFVVKLPRTERVAG